jgi:hypothetical protein
VSAPECEFDPEFDDWPHVEEATQVWVEFAVSRGVKRDAASRMDKSDLIKYLTRLDNTSE